MGDRGRVVLGALAALLVAVGVLVCLAGGAPPDPDPDYVGPANVPAAPGAGGPHEAAPLVDTQPDAPVKDYRATPDRTQLPPTETWIVRLRAHRGRDEPFAGARLRAAVYPGHEARGEPLHETTLTSGEDGAAVWHLPVPAQTVTVEVGSGDAEVVGRKAAAVVLEGEAARTLDVYLFPLDHVVRGVVTTADGKPVAAARVSWSQYLPPTYTDDQGRFRLRVASAYSRLRYYVVLAGYSRFTETLSLDGPGTTDVEVQLQPGFRAFGRVTDTGGRPLQGVQVATFWARYTGEQTLTDAEGNYQLDTLDPAVDTHYVLATLDGYARAQGHARGGGTEARIDLVLKCTATVTGTVFGPAGRPLAGAMVGISGGSRPTGAGTVVTGDDGHFTLHPSRRGKPYLWTHRRGFAIDRRYIELAAGTTHVLVHLQRGHFVAGRVTDPDGQPVPGARLRAYLGRSAGLRNDVITGADGRYRLLDLPEQKLRLTVSAPGHVTVRRRELVLDSESFDIVLQRSVVLRGRVVDGSSGAPIQEFRIRVLKRSKGGVGMPWLGQGQRFHDTDGYWKTGRERVVPGTTFDLEAVADGYAPTVLKNITATPDMAPNAVLFQLFAGVALHGQVLCRATGRPVAGAKITLLEPGRRRLPPSLGADTATRSADDGTFIFEHVASGDFLLKTEDKDKPPFLHGPLTVPATGTMDRVIVQLPAAGRIEGVLKDESGHGLPNVAVKLTPGRVGQRQLWLGRKTCRTDAAGGFRFDGLVNTDYVLTASSEGLDGVTSVFRTEVKVQDDGPTQVLMAPMGACSVTGTVRFLGRTGTDVRIQLYRRSDLAGVKARWQTFGAGVTADRFAVRGLPEGIYNFATVYRIDGKRRRHSGPRKVAIRRGATNEVSIEVSPR